MIGRTIGFIALLLFTHLWWRAEAGFFAGPFLVTYSNSMGFIWNAGLLFLFYLSHSLMASTQVKKWMHLSAHEERRVYLVVTLWFTALAWSLWAPLPTPTLWSVEFPLSIPFYVIQITGFLGLLWTIRAFPLLDFFGDKKEQNPQTSRLITTGAFALCRHPLYFFLILLLCSPQIALGRAVLAVSVIFYIVVGSLLEEKKCAAQWGEAYANYRLQTPWLIPTPRSVRLSLSKPVIRPTK